MQMFVNLTNQRQRISSLLVSLRPTNAANTDEGLEPDFIISTLRKRGRRRRKEEREGGRKERSGDGDKRMRKHRPQFRALSTPNIKLAK